MKICINCKWWEPRKDDDEHGDCEQLTNYRLPDEQICQVYSDSEPITTGRAFGCIHWEAKP